MIRFTLLLTALFFSKICTAATATSPSPTSPGQDFEKGKQRLRVEAEHEIAEAYLRERQDYFLQHVFAVAPQLDAEIKAPKKRSVLTRLKPYYRPPGVESWMKAHFPAEFCRRWFGAEDALAMDSKNRDLLKTGITQQFDQLCEDMMKARRQMADRYGALTMTLNKKKDWNEFVAEGTALISRLSQQDGEDHADTIFNYFQDREGSTLAQLRADMYITMRDLNQKAKKLKAAPDSQDLQDKIHAHMAELKGRMGRLAKWKLRFYREALFFYQNEDGAFDGDRFHDADGGVAHLFRHLGTRKGEFSEIGIFYAGERNEGVGYALYESLAEKRKKYVEARRALLAELETARAAGTSIRRDTHALKALADPVRTLDLDKSFKAMEQNEAARIMAIMDLEQHLLSKTGVTITEIDEAKEAAAAAQKAFQDGVQEAVADYKNYLNGATAPLSLT